MAKKKNKNADKNFRIVKLIGVAALFFIVIIILNQRPFTKFQNPNNTLMPSSSPPPTIKNFNSKFLKIFFSTPSGYDISENSNHISLNNNIGEIIISKRGTNNDTIEGAVFEISDRGTMQVANKQSMKINNIDVISCSIKSLVSDEPESKGYYFYPVPWTVFSITTNNSELFDDLDQIARSFRYEP